MSIVFNAVKTKGQRDNQTLTESLALYITGLLDGSRLCILGARSRGFNSPQVQHMNQRPTSRGNYPWGTSLRRSQKDGVSTRTVIFAHAPEESKGENDLPQLPNRMPEIWGDPEGPPTVSLLSML